MKKITLSLVILFVVFSNLSAQTEQRDLADIRKGVAASEIEDITFHIAKKPDKVDGYVVFLDKDNRFCSTIGVLTLSVKKKYVIGRTGSIPKPVEVYRYEIGHTEEVFFEPKDFLLMGLPLGGIIFGLPITLPEDKVEKNDTVILEWEDFKREQAPQEY
ncbi:MAG: hypothetical protein JW788_07345 [Candidatus Omnitrophica bacterium]|nr:hypothetical protein [Candidatus Omnitrophota bacterium]